MDSAGKMYVTFWGTRGSISTPGGRTEKYGGNTPCVSIRYNDTDIIFDAGTGIRNLGLDLAQQAVKQNKGMSLHLLLSHTHWDHIQGLPFFAPAYMASTKLHIYGSPKKERFLQAILAGQMDQNYFPVEMREFTAHLKIIEISRKQIHVGPVTIDWQEQVCHPGGSVRYRIEVGGRRVVYATDVELDMIFRPKKVTAKSKALSKEYIDFIRDADLLIADSQYTAKEYVSKRGWGHTSIPVLVKAANRARVKQLVMFHHDPQHSDAMLDKLWTQYGPPYATAKPPMNIFWAREGLTLAV